MQGFAHLPDPEIGSRILCRCPMKRLVAWLADTVLIVLISLLIVPHRLYGLFFFPLLTLAVGFAYRCDHAPNRSATWGMRLMAIEFRAHGHGDGRAGSGRAAYAGLRPFAMPLLQVMSVGADADHRAQVRG
jgi:hypothetical protein